jgi:chromosome segregation ATPase
MPEKNDVVEYRLGALEASFTEIKGAVTSIDKSLQKLTSLEESHQETRNALNRAFAQIEDHEFRLRHVEKEAPVTKLVRNWIIAGITGIIGMAAIALASRL